MPKTTSCRTVDDLALGSDGSPSPPRNDVPCPSGRRRDGDPATFDGSREPFRKAENRHREPPRGARAPSSGPHRGRWRARSRSDGPSAFAKASRWRKTSIRRPPSRRFTPIRHPVRRFLHRTGPSFGSRAFGTRRSAIAQRGFAFRYARIRRTVTPTRDPVACVRPSVAGIRRAVRTGPSLRTGASAAAYPSVRRCDARIHVTRVRRRVVVGVPRATTPRVTGGYVVRNAYPPRPRPWGRRPAPSVPTRGCGRKATERFHGGRRGGLPGPRLIGQPIIVLVSWTKHRESSPTDEVDPPCGSPPS